MTLIIFSLHHLFGASRMKLLELFFILMLFYISTSSAKRGKYSRRDNTLKVANQENDYLNWINRMSSRNHSVFQQAKNKLVPCKFIKVNKNPKFGDFTTIQKAIDSIPIINLCRVVISVIPGTYR